MSSPRTADAALSVGAIDHDDRLADFSSRGPRLGDDAIKPGITAPGVDVSGARSADARGTGPYAKPVRVSVPPADAVRTGSGVQVGIRGGVPDQLILK